MRNIFADASASDIAQCEGVPRHRVTYAIRMASVKPTRCAGVVRLFSLDGVKLIVAELRRIEGVPGPGRTREAAQERTVSTQ